MRLASMFILVLIFQFLLGASQLVAQSPMNASPSSGSIGMGGSSVPGWVMFGVPVVVVAIAAGIYFWHQRPLGAANSPEALFYELCRAHRLGRGPRQLLERISRAAEIEHPATMFLCQERMDSAVDTARRRIAFNKRQLGYLSLVKRKVFS